MGNVTFDISRELEAAKREDSINRPLAINTVAKKALQLRALSHYPEVFRALGENVLCNHYGAQYRVEILYDTYYGLKQRYEKGIIVNPNFYLFLAEESINMHKTCDLLYRDANPVFCKTMHRFAMIAIQAVVGMSAQDWRKARRIHRLGKCFLKHEKDRGVKKQWKKDDAFMSIQIWKLENNWSR